MMYTHTIYSIVFPLSPDIFVFWFYSNLLHYLQKPQRLLNLILTAKLLRSSPFLSILPYQVICIFSYSNFSVHLLASSFTAWQKGLDHTEHPFFCLIWRAYCQHPLNSQVDNIRQSVTKLVFGGFSLNLIWVKEVCFRSKVRLSHYVTMHTEVFGTLRYLWEPVI